jgi:hypothetical protein
MSRILSFVIAILLIIAGVGACADLELMGTGDTHHYFYFCIVTDTLTIPADTVACAGLPGEDTVTAEPFVGPGPFVPYDGE